MCALFSSAPAKSFRVEGKQIVCPHCDNVLFHDRKASLNTAASELFNVAWADRQARVLICANCSRMEWFHDSDLVVAQDS
jgi:predicted nucleic-acid-binding Zn-ribbon protein